MSVVEGVSPAGTRRVALRWAGHPRVALAAAVLPLPAGLLAWAAAVRGLRLSGIGLYGVLAAVSPWFFVGLALIVAGFAVELVRGRPRQWLLGLYVVGLIVAIHATVPLVSHAPEYAWVYKHVGVAASLNAHGAVTDPTDIYQAWPGFFSALAALSALSGVGPIAFATWAPPVFELGFALLLLAVFRTLTRDPRLPFLAVALFVGLVSWVGQDYLSPQAFGYLLWLGVVLIALRYLRSEPVADPVGRRARLRAWLLGSLPRIGAVEGRRRIALLVLSVLLFAAIVISHQLSPFVALAALVALTVLDLVRPRWLVVALAGIAVAFLVSRYSIIALQYGGLFSGTDVLANASGSVAHWGSSAQGFTATAVRILAGAMWASAALVALVRGRRDGRLALVAVLAFSPFVLLLGQSYGGEAIYRVFLFSAPWCAYLVASALLAVRRTHLRLGVVVVATLAILAAGLQGLYGPVAANAFTPGEVSASTWFYDHAAPGSTLVLATGDFPALQSADYERYPLQVLPADPQVGESWLHLGDTGEVDRYVASLGRGPTYLAVSRTMAAYSAYYGFPTGLDRLEAHLATSPNWRLVHHDADASIYRFAAR